jgi:hypothetical protein
MRENSGSDITLYEISKSILNKWAQRIENEGLSVSLEAVVESTLVQAPRSSTIDVLVEQGHDVIDLAAKLELSFLQRAGSSRIANCFNHSKRRLGAFE